MSASIPPPPDLRAAVRAVLLDQLDTLTDEVARHLAARAATTDLPTGGTAMDGSVSPAPGNVEEERFVEALAKLKEELAQKQREAAEIQAASQRQLDETGVRVKQAREALRLVESARREQEEAAARSLAELEARRQEFDAFRLAGERSDRLLARLLPEWLRDDSLTKWQGRIEKMVFEADASPSFGLLFAALHGYTAALPDTDPKTLLDALRDVGRRLFTFLGEDGSADTETDRAHAAEQWARAINRECAGRCEVEVPVPGNAANNQWMFFQPRGGSSPDVVSVRSWCVRDAQRRPVHRAEVVV